MPLPLPDPDMTPIRPSVASHWYCAFVGTEVDLTQILTSEADLAFSFEEGTYYNIPLDVYPNLNPDPAKAGLVVELKPGGNIEPIDPKDF